VHKADKRSFMLARKTSCLARALALIEQSSISANAVASGALQRRIMSAACAPSPEHFTKRRKKSTCDVLVRLRSSREASASAVMLVVNVLDKYTQKSI
jgi:hypothetical protein